MKNKLLIFDFKNLLHRSMHAYQGLSHNDISTSGIFGFVVLFCNQVNKHQPDDVLFCTDSPPYVKKELYTQYKSDRKKMEPEAYEMLKINNDYCTTFLNTLNITLWEEKGQEADDLIAIAVDEYWNQYNNIVIVSNDDDMFQLFKYPNVVLQRGKNIYAKQDFLAEYPDMNSKLWVIVKALAGTHNGVPGLPRVGMKTALKIINNPSKWAEAMIEHGDTIELFKRIIKLPFDDSIDACKIEKADFSNRQMINLLAKFGIKYQNNFDSAFDTLKNKS